MIQPDYTPAKLYTGGGNLKVRWYAYYSIRNSVTGLLEVRKKKAGINRGKTVKERTRLGAMLVSELNAMLKQGWRDHSPSEAKKVLPLKDVLTELLEVKKGTLRRRTWQSYKYALDVFFKWMDHADAAYIFPVQFNNTMAHNFSDYLQGVKNLKGKSFNSCKNNLSVIINMMVEREIIAKNPLSKIKNLKEEVGKNIAFSAKQQKDLTKYLKSNNPRLHLFTQFIYFCYIRPIELLRLRVSNVDVKSGTVTIYGDQSKNKKTETVVIPDKFIGVVKQMRLDKFSPQDYLFGYQLQTCGKSYSRNQVTRQHTVALKALSMPVEVTMYSWKHTGIVSAHKSGIDIYSIMRQCRHGSINETQRYLKSLGLLPNVEFASKMK